MLRSRMCRFGLLCVCLAGIVLAAASGKEPAGITVDKDNKLIRIDAKIAPRKLPHLSEVYPIEIIAGWPHPKGKKAHETVVTIDAKPSDVHKALEAFGLKPGRPVVGESKDPPQGPDVSLWIEVPDPDSNPKKLTMDKVLIDRGNKKPFPKTVKWRFTGSDMIQPDPEKDDKVYGADLDGVLIAIFPVTSKTVFQTNLTMENEKYLKLETNTSALPKEGTPVKLVIEVPGR